MHGPTACGFNQCLVAPALHSLSAALLAATHCSQCCRCIGSGAADWWHTVLRVVILQGLIAATNSVQHKAALLGLVAAGSTSVSACMCQLLVQCRCVTPLFIVEQDWSFVFCQFDILHEVDWLKESPPCLACSPQSAGQALSHSVGWAGASQHVCTHVQHGPGSKTWPGQCLKSCMLMHSSCSY